MNASILRSEVRLSTLVLVTIGMFDLVSTLIWLNHGFGEANPLFATLAQTGGAFGFAAGKIVFLAGPVLLLEYVRRLRPQSAEQGTWIAAGLYGSLYVTHLLSLMVRI